MTIPRNLSFLAEGASSTGVLGTANGGTGLNTLGTAGQALVVNSGATGLTYSTPSAGAMALISTQTASGSSSIAFTGLSGYDKYFLILQNILPSAANGILEMQVGTGAGPTYITSGYANQISEITTTLNAVRNGDTTVLVYASSQVGSSNSVNGFSGKLVFTNMTSGGATDVTGVLGWADASTTIVSAPLSGFTTNTTAKTAIKIFFNTGNITSGKASLYGISS